MSNEDLQTNVSGISLKDIIKILSRRWWIIVLSVVICACGMFVYCYKTSVQKYSATVKLYIDNAQVSISSTKISVSDISASQSLVPTYGEILNTFTTYEEVCSRLPEDGGYEQSIYNKNSLSKMVKFGALNDTQILYVTVTTNNISHSVKIANTIATVLNERVEEIMQGSRAIVVDRAQEDQIVKVSSGTLKKVAIATAIGLVVSLLIVFAIELIFNDIIDEETWLSERFKGKIPVLGSVPDVQSNSSHRYGYHSYYKYYGYYGYGEKSKKDNK